MPLLFARPHSRFLHPAGEANVADKVHEPGLCAGADRRTALLPYRSAAAAKAAEFGLLAAGERERTSAAKSKDTQASQRFEAFAIFPSFCAISIPRSAADRSGFSSTEFLLLMNCSWMRNSSSGKGIVWRDRAAQEECALHPGPACQFISGQAVALHAGDRAIDVAASRTAAGIADALKRNARYRGGSETWTL